MTADEIARIDKLIEEVIEHKAAQKAQAKRFELVEEPEGGKGGARGRRGPMCLKSEQAGKSTAELIRLWVSAASGNGRRREENVEVVTPI